MSSFREFHFSLKWDPSMKNLIGNQRESEAWYLLLSNSISYPSNRTKSKTANIDHSILNAYYGLKCPLLMFSSIEFHQSHFTQKSIRLNMETIGKVISSKSL